MSQSGLQKGDLVSPDYYFFFVTPFLAWAKAQLEIKGEKNPIAIEINIFILCFFDIFRKPHVAANIGPTLSN